MKIGNLGVGLVNIDNKDCIRLQAVQTPDRQTLEFRDACITPNNMK